MAKTAEIPKILILLNEAHNFLTEAGPRQSILPLYYIINVQKMGVMPLILFAMFIGQNFSHGMMIYLALHGSYGVIWGLKEFVAPDPIFRKKFPWLGTVGTAGALTLYCMIPVLMVSAKQPPSPLRAFISIFAYVIGIVTMIGSDIQKFYTLKFSPGLITTGFFARTRNPNYFGEALLYSAFANLTGSWMAWAILAIVWSTIFTLRISSKEFRLRQKPGASEYLLRSNLFLPRICADQGLDMLSWLLVGALVLIVLIFQ